jgi:hypothetical protein
MHMTMALMNDQYHRRGGHANQEGEVSDVEPPGNLISHGGHHQTLIELLNVGQDSSDHQAEQKDHPGPVGRRTPQYQPNRAGGEFPETSDQVHNASSPVRLRRNRKN